MKKTSYTDSTLQKNLPYALAYINILTDSKGHPIDAIFKDVNPAFEEMMGLSKDQILNKRPTDAPEEIKDLEIDWIYYYQELVSQSGPVSFTFYAKSLNDWYDVTLTRDSKDYFFALFQEGTKDRIVDHRKEEIPSQEDTPLSQEEEEDLTLAHFINVEATQSLMDDFYELTRFGVALVDNKGEILVKTGWQDICTEFHRTNPKTREYCIESDIELTKNLKPGTFKKYKCKNNMWDIATPIIIGEKHMGNLFLGQFFFEDEEVDYEVFKAQAKKYGFNQEAYREALDKVPRWSRSKVYKVMEFYTKLARMLSLLSYRNRKLKHLIAEQNRMIEQLQEAERQLAENSKKIEDLYLQQERQMERAQEIHQHILPTHLPKIKEISFSAFYQPAEKLGGDFYDILHIDNKVILYLSDVSGHGLDSALLSLFIKHTIKNFITFSTSDAITPVNILQYLTDAFREENYPDEYFICIFLAIFHLETKRLHYIGAGFQDHPLVLTGHGLKRVLESRGLFITHLFSDEELDFKEESLLISPGTTIFFNTDGLTEEGTPHNLYRERLPKVFYENAHRTPSSIREAVKKDFQEFNQGSLQARDDITFLVLHIHE